MAKINHQRPIIRVKDSQKRESKESKPELRKFAEKVMDKRFMSRDK